MIERYNLTDRELLRLPRILIYLEEFLYWKKSLKNFVDSETAQAAMIAFMGLATRGLKVGMHLMACTQVDYADEELRDAIAQFVGINMCYAVKPSAAQAAGFVETELLAQNYSDRKPGQFVLEAVSNRDIVIAPEYDVKAKLALLPEIADSSQYSLSRGHTVTLPAMEDLPPLPDLPMKQTSQDNIIPLRQSTARKATIADAIAVWNECGEMGRPRLRKELQARGLDCSDDLSMRLLASIKERIEEAQ